MQHLIELQGQISRYRQELAGAKNIQQHVELVDAFQLVVKRILDDGEVAQLFQLNQLNLKLQFQAEEINERQQYGFTPISTVRQCNDLVFLATNELKAPMAQIESDTGLLTQIHSQFTDYISQQQQIYRSLKSSLDQQKRNADTFLKSQMEAAKRRKASYQKDKTEIEMKIEKLQSSAAQNSDTLSEAKNMARQNEDAANNVIELQERIRQRQDELGEASRQIAESWCGQTEEVREQLARCLQQQQTVLSAMPGKENADTTDRDRLRDLANQLALEAQRVDTFLGGEGTSASQMQGVYERYMTAQRK